MNFIFSFIWFFISIFEKIYWYIKRKNQIGTLSECGNSVTIGRHCTFLGNIFIGNDVYIGEYCRLQSVKSRIILGDHIMFGPNVSIHAGNHRIDLVGKFMKNVKSHEKREEDDLDVIIENDVWIGSGVIVLQGVVIGEGSVIGAGCVISNSVPPYSIVVGNKTRQVSKRFDADTILIHKRLLKDES